MHTGVTVRFSRSSHVVSHREAFVETSMSPPFTSDCRFNNIFSLLTSVSPDVFSYGCAASFRDCSISRNFMTRFVALLTLRRYARRFELQRRFYNSRIAKSLESSSARRPKGNHGLVRTVWPVFILFSAPRISRPLREYSHNASLSLHKRTVTAYS